MLPNVAWVLGTESDTEFRGFLQFLLFLTFLRLKLRKNPVCAKKDSVRDREAGGSNPPSPILILEFGRKYRPPSYWRSFFCPNSVVDRQQNTWFLVRLYDIRRVYDRIGLGPGPGRALGSTGLCGDLELERPQRYQRISGAAQRGVNIFLSW